MKNTGNIFSFVLLLLVQFAAYRCAPKNDQTAAIPKSTTSASQSAVDRHTAAASYTGSADFVAAAKAVMPAVVHLKILFNTAAQYGASGSGVIISEDGYIATNNHVVENAAAVEVILPDKRRFEAKLVGRDPNTDLALVKIEAGNLPVVAFGNSDSVQVGEWVLAVGFPLSLNTTVTAGIVSAKARSIGIINRPASGFTQENTPQGGNQAVEAFIQTDAAINPGNSGGALVNTGGQLIGINSAIASQTGSYAGYAFAVPVNLAKKILNDLKTFGTVKRGVLGVSFPAPLAEDQYFARQGLDPASVKGVYLTGVQDGSAAAAAGLKEGDVIQSIDGEPLSSSSEFSERIARHNPGDVISLTYLRNGRAATTQATLKAEDAPGARASATDLREIYNRLGATFAPITADIKQRWGIASGVAVRNVQRGGFFDRVGIPPGTIIVFINGKPVNNPGDVDTALVSAQSGNVQILAIAPDGSRVVFNFSLGT